MSRSTPSPTPLGRRFIMVWFGQTLSAIGSNLSGVGVAVHVFVETGSAAWLGLLAALASLPALLTAPLLSLTDRFRRRSVMIWADTFAVIGPAVAFVLAVTGELEMWHLGVAAILGGIGSSFQVPAAQAVVPALVEPEVLDRANGLNQLGPAIGIVLGPILATPLVAWWGIEAVLLVDLVTFALAVGTTLAVKFDDARDAADVPDVPDDGSWRALWVWLCGHGRPLIVLLAVMAAVNFFMAFFNISVIVVATELGGVARTGLVLGAGGAAMIVGSLVSARRGVGADRIGTFARGLVLAGGGFVAAASYPSMIVVIAGVAFALGAVPAVQAAVSTVYHERVPASMYGRVFGLRTSIGRALDPVGAVLAGVVVAELAEPALAPEGSLSGSVGQLIGTGAGRGAALVLGLVGGVLVVIGLLVAGSRTRQTLRAAPASAVEEVGALETVATGDDR